MRLTENRLSHSDRDSNAESPSKSLFTGLIKQGLFFVLGLLLLLGAFSAAEHLHGSLLSGMAVISILIFLKNT